MTQQSPYTPQNVVDLVTLVRNTDSLNATDSVAATLDHAILLKSVYTDFAKLVEMKGRGLVFSPKLQNGLKTLKSVGARMALPLLLDAIDEFEKKEHTKDDDPFRLDLAIIMYHIMVAETACKLVLEISYGLGHAPNGKPLDFTL